MRKLFIILVLTALCVTPAFALTQTDSANLTWGAMDWSDTVSLDKWNADTSIYALTSIDIQLTGYIKGDVLYDVISGDNVDIYSWMNGNFSLYYPTPPGGKILGAQANAYAAHTWTSKNQGDSGSQFVTGSDGPHNEFLASSWYSDFTGTDNILLPIVASLNYGGSSSGGTSSFGTSNVEGRGDVTITYTYDRSAVPEPSTAALMLLGLAGMGLVAFRRRRRS